MTANRSKVRRCALSFIYALSEGSSADFDRDLFWDMALEKENDRYRIALTKALLHICRRSADSARLLTERSQALETAMHGDLTTAPLREEVARYARCSASFESTLCELQNSLTDKRRDTTEPLAELTAQLTESADVLVQLGESLLTPLADAAPYRAVTEPYAALLRRRARMLGAAAELRHPLEIPEQKEYAGLQHLAREIAELRPAAEELAEAVLTHSAEYDALLTELLENYSTERLDAVDKAILYISLYELKENKLEVAIVVSEATALADAYSGPKSAPFIHGIISAAARR